MLRIPKEILGFNWIALAVMLALSLLLGVLNNFRVDEEKQVPWFGDNEASADAEEEGLP